MYISLYFFFFYQSADYRYLHYPLRRQRQMCIRDRQLIDQEAKLQEENNVGCYLCCIHCCGSCWGCCSAWTGCTMCVSNPYWRVQEGYEGVIERFGKFVKRVKPGLHYVNPCTETMRYVNIKTQIIDLARQVCITRDNISVTIDASVYFKIIDPKRSLYRVFNVTDAVRFLTFSTLRNISGEHTLQQLLEKRIEITALIIQYVDEHVDEWGVRISQIFIKDILLTQDLQVALSSAAKEKRLAASKLISARADVEAAKLMRESADILNTRPAMQIRYLETIQEIAKKPSPKLVFLPFDENAGTN
eukprot:TRINITY_DN4329_c0_g2_i1.p1 TRINITY_DN4329_c0_g2~~TRINITY_DN4329_c0_g2_i1.p1  ORF type:complete len:303 (-),score=39.05 TRINITY_DN4329_c0_g2_i1:203-1111(-)